ncbi:MAG: helix-turn-helix domain-containing protein [Ruminococcus sp.]
MVEDTMFSGESKNIEYKVSLPDKSEKYMKTIVAFANTQGGKLIVGVDDKTHQIVGVENDVLFQMMDELPMQFLIPVCHRLFLILSHRR